MIDTSIVDGVINQLITGGYHIVVNKQFVNWKITIFDG